MTRMNPTTAPSNEVAHLWASGGDHQRPPVRPRFSLKDPSGKDRPTTAGPREEQANDKRQQASQGPRNGRSPLQQNATAGDEAAARQPSPSLAPRGKSWLVLPECLDDRSIGFPRGGARAVISLWLPCRVMCGVVCDGTCVQNQAKNRNAASENEKETEKEKKKGRKTAASPHTAGAADVCCAHLPLAEVLHAALLHLGVVDDLKVGLVLVRVGKGIAAAKVVAKASGVPLHVLRRKEIGGLAGVGWGGSGGVGNVARERRARRGKRKGQN